MDLTTLKGEIALFHQNMDSFVIAANTDDTSSISQQELANVAATLKRAVTSCEACHSQAAALIQQKLLDNHDPLVIEIWNLTKALEYTKRKYGSWVLAKQREKR